MENCQHFHRHKFVPASEQPTSPLPQKKIQRGVVQRWVSAKPWLKLNPLFSFRCFYTSVHFKILGDRNLNQTRFVKKYLRDYNQVAGKFLLNFSSLLKITLELCENNAEDNYRRIIPRSTPEYLILLIKCLQSSCKKKDKRRYGEISSDQHKNECYVIYSHPSYVYRHTQNY